MFDILISINVHEKFDFLMEQLDNIHFFTSHLNVCIIYNCNNFMLQELLKHKFKSYKNLKIIINPESIEKRRWYGSLCKGIIKNMEYVIDNNIKFREFIVLSSRNILQSKLDLFFIEKQYKFYYENILKLVKDNRRFYFNKYNKFYICDGSKQNYWHGDMTTSRYWFWGKIKNTEWFKKLDKQVDFFIGGRHEGLCIPYENIFKIVDFCKSNDDILSNCYTYNIALEEVIPQVLACKFKTNNKMYCLLEPPFIKIERDIEDIKRERQKYEKYFMNSLIKNNYNRIYFLCGNARTFLNCFDSTYKKIIDKLFCNNTKKNTHVLFYLKCDDPGQKGQKNWNFEYPLIDKTVLKNKISEFTEKYNNISFHSEILFSNKISDNELWTQVKTRKLYTGFFNDDKKLLRSLHCHYNFEDCGKIINQIESHNKFNFDFYIYIRPDLFFEKPCHNISEYITNTDKIILGKGPNNYNNDHIAIIPNKYKYNFFFERMNLIRTNHKIHLCNSEQIYWHTIKDKYIVKPIGKYIIKRKVN